MSTQMLVQLAVCGLLISFSPNIYLWFKGADKVEDESDLLLLMSRLSLEEIEKVRRLGQAAPVGTLMAAFAVTVLLLRGFGM